MAGIDELTGDVAISIEPIRLSVGPMRSADIDAFVPVEAQPSEVLLDGFFRLGR